MKNSLSLLFVGLFLISPLAGAAPMAGPELPDLVEKVMPGVVNISTITTMNYQVPGWEDFMQFWGIPEERKQTSLGSGFIIDKDGYILTNHHVVAQATEVQVTLKDKQNYRARIIGKDPKMDIALLQIRDDKKQVPPGLQSVILADSDRVRIGESVFAVGNPFGLQHTVTIGIISAKNRTIGVGPFDNFLQTDASINPGNSGGPLFNMKGEVIGINTLIFSRTMQSAGLGFAIPINEAKQILADLKRYGRVPRPWLGLLTERVTPAIQQYYNLPVSSGVVVYNLVQSAPGDDAGLQRGDIIIEADGQPIEDQNDLEKQLFKHKPNETVTVKFYRGKKILTQKIKLEEFPPRAANQLPQGVL